MPDAPGAEMAHVQVYRNNLLEPHLRPKPGSVSVQANWDVSVRSGGQRGPLLIELSGMLPILGNFLWRHTKAHMVPQIR